EWLLEITEYECGRLLGISATCGDTLVTERHCFVPCEGETRYTLTTEVHGQRPRPMVQRQTIELLLHFKWCLEQPDRKPPQMRRARPDRGGQGLVAVGTAAIPAATG